MLKQWNFNDEYMPVQGVWGDQAEHRAGQAYNAIRTRLGQLGLLEGSGYEKPLDQMLAEDRAPDAMGDRGRSRGGNPIGT